MHLDPHDDELATTLREKALARLSQGFMQPQIVLDDWIEVENRRGESSFMPEDVFNAADYLAECLNGESVTITRHKMLWGARLSAPGYLDATDWIGPFKTQEEAEQELIELYDTDDDCEEED